MHHRLLIGLVSLLALTALGQALHQIIRNHRITPYSSTAYDTSDALKFLDEDPANTNSVWLLYAQRTEPKSTFGLTTGWNREHQWCDSYGLDGREPAYSDLHNLRAEDSNVNSARGNKYYDISDPVDANYKSLTRAALSTCVCQKSNFQSV